MTSRKDQLHSYQFMLQRVVSALIMRETDPAQAPLRRGVGAIFIGVMIAVVVAAGFGVYGLLTKIGSGRWRVDGAVIIEKETGGAFVYNQNTLTPTLNYTSALLLSGKSPPAVFSVSRNSLTGVPRGVTRGIPNAPDALPDRKKVTQVPWTLCSVPGEDEAGKSIVTTELAVGRAADGGNDLGSRALLVKDIRIGEIYLVWQSHRYQIDEPGTVLPSLFGAEPQQVSAGTAWLNGLPRGEDIGPIPVPGRGMASGAVPGRSIGDLVFDRVGTGPQNYLVLGDGLAPITTLQKDILAGQFSVTPKEISAAVVNQTPKSARLTENGPAGVVAPKETPQLAQLSSESGAVCAESRDARSAPKVRVNAKFPSLGPGLRTGSVTRTGTSLADLVAVPAGEVAVVRAMASPTAQTGAYSVVTDIGIRYAVPSPEVLALLGYTTGDAVDLPASLVNRVPPGPTLSPLDAGTAVQPQAVPNGN